MKKFVSLFLALTMFVAVFATLGLTVGATSEIQYSDHMQGATRYEITDSSIAWVKQATGALIWVYGDDTRTKAEIVAQAKNADPSLKNACNAFEVLRGVGIKYTPNANGSKTKVTVAEEDGKLYMILGGNYSHFVKGDGGKAVAPTPVPTAVPTAAPTAAPTATPAPGTTAEPTAVPTATPAPTAAPVVPETPATGETINIRIDTAKKMAVRFEDGNVYYNGDLKEIEIGKEYLFQICSVNWENGIYDDEGNGLCGTVVYRMKVVHEKEFKTIREIALQNPERYTVKGMDIIDNLNKVIIINCDAENFHLETDVNNFFMAYRFHFEKGDYNKQTGIKNVVNPTESLSVNLPLGTTVTADAYAKFSKIASAAILVENNNGTGVYENVYLTSVNDYTWNY